MFEDDPEMQELVRKAQADPEPEHKPWWYGAIVGVAMLAVGASDRHTFPDMGVLAYRASVFPLFAGGLLAIGVLGWRPGNYRNIQTDERLVLWKPLKLWLRGLYVLASGAVLVFGAWVAYSDITRL